MTPRCRWLLKYDYERALIVDEGHNIALMTWALIRPPDARWRPRPSERGFVARHPAAAVQAACDLNCICRRRRCRPRPSPAAGRRTRGSRAPASIAPMVRAAATQRA